MIAAATNPTAWNEHAFWLASRAAGIVAMGLMTFTVIVGLMQGGNLLRSMNNRTRERAGVKPRDLTRMHQFVSLAAIIAIVSHGLLLMGDAWLNPSFSQVVVPFSLDYRTFYTGLGVTAGWVVVLLGLTYYLRDQIGVKRWKTLHRFTIVGYALSVVHVMGAGTDSQSAWLFYPMMISVAVVAVLFTLRMRSHTARPVARNMRTVSRV